VILDRGKGNILDRETVAELRKVIGLCTEEDLRAVILDHTGKNFSVGASVEEHRADTAADLLGEFHLLARELLALSVPILACVRGYCLGGGLELAALADRVFAAPDSTFGQPEIRLGVFAPLGSALLPRVLAPRHAADLLLSGRYVDCQQAMAMGLVHEVSRDPSTAASAYFDEHLAGKSASSLRWATRAARRPWLNAFLHDLEGLEAEYLQGLMPTHDAEEGIEAFIAKRQPAWENR
jgi:cyclohexa-1,5-dienecarbonyl-CoA hydratase